jgi:hypothetical protein
MSPKLKCNQNWIVTKTEMSPNLKRHQSWNVTKTEMSPELKWNQSWNVTKTEMLPNLKCYQNWNFTKSKNVFKIKIKIQQIGTNYIDLREDIQKKKRLSFGHCPKVALTPPPPSFGHPRGNFFIGPLWTILLKVQNWFLKHFLIKY